MKLRNSIIDKIAEMIVGDNPLFPYRSSSLITRFFNRCGFNFTHDGSTRRRWVSERLIELNEGPAERQDLPSNEIVRMLTELFDAEDFEKEGKVVESALIELNLILQKQSLEMYYDDSCLHIRNLGSGVNSTQIARLPRPLSASEIEQRTKIAAFLDLASEDIFTEQLLVPLFLRLGFHRVSSLGHKEKTLEYGKDLWMKYQLPTNHWLYFGAQIKREKLDVRGNSGDSNTATVLNQIRMAMDNPVFDPETNRKVLIDHMFIISAGEITRAAKNWLIEALDQSQRRQIIFMDRSEFLDHGAKIMFDLKTDDFRPKVK